VRLDAKGRIFVIVYFFLVIFVIIIISLRGGAGGLSVSLLLESVLLLFLVLNAHSLAGKPVDDLNGVHRVLRIMLEHEHHLLLVGRTLVLEENW
jgi:hypothetical protein